MSNSNFNAGVGQLFYLYNGATVALSGTSGSAGAIAAHSGSTLLSGIFSLEDGISYDGKSVEAVNVSVQDDVVSQFIAGDHVTYGQVTVSAFINKDANLDDIVGTCGSLIWSTDGLQTPNRSYPHQTEIVHADDQASFHVNTEGNFVDAMSRGKYGGAILVSANVTAANNAAQKASLVFQWEGAVTTKTADAAATTLSVQDNW